MEARVKVLGHAVHPMVITFPIALYTTSIVFDVLYLGTERAGFAATAAYLIAAGFIGGAAAALFGWIDWFGIPRGTRARKVGLMHGLSAGALNLLFLVSWLLRFGAGNWEPSALAIAFSVVGLAVLGAQAWLGGELIERLGVSVDEGANLNAPSSLRHKAA